MMQHQKIEKKNHQSPLCFYWQNFARKEKFKIKIKILKKRNKKVDRMFSVDRSEKTKF